jgi:two-component system NtrC family sensor kinase
LGNCEKFGGGYLIRLFVIRMNHVMDIPNALFRQLFSTVSAVNTVQLNHIKDPQKQSALLRKIIDRIRNSLELKVVLQTAVDEIGTLLNLDRCSFLWYFEDTQRVQAVCEWTGGRQRPSQLGYYPLESFGSMAPAIAQGALIINHGPRTTPTGFGAVMQFMSGLPMMRRAESWENREQQPSASPKLLGAVANLLVPVRNEAGWVGFITCLCDQPRRWKPNEIEFVQSIAQQLEIAIRQAQLYEQTQKQAQRERLVNQITNQTRQSLNLSTILHEAIAQLMDALKADRCLVHLVEEIEQGEVQEASLITQGAAFRRRHMFEVCRDPFPPSVEEFDTHGPITQWVIEHRQLVMIPDIRKDPRIGPNNFEYEQACIQSSLVVPVQANGQLLAILYINQCSQTRYWSKNDRDLAQAVADQLAISIHQACLYAKARTAAATATAQAQQLSQLLHDLQQSQAQLIQTEKMSSLGQLVAGVAHEINNPVNFIYGNISYANNYIEELLDLVDLYQKHYPQPAVEIAERAAEIDLNFLKDDLPKLLASMKMGADRIRQIVLSLRNFSRVDQAEMKRVDLHEGIDNTLLILQNRLKPQGKYPGVALIKDYSELPLVECFAGQMNQVFMNILGNALDALEACQWPKYSEHSAHSTYETVEPIMPMIRICTEISRSDYVKIRISDNGLGISEEVQSRLFDPFFTTKPVGKGTGLGLSISYQIVVDKHGGSLYCLSQPGQGTEFVIEIPVKPETHKAENTRGKLMMSESRSPALSNQMVMAKG